MKSVAAGFDASNNSRNGITAAERLTGTLPGFGKLMLAKTALVIAVFSLLTSTAFAEVADDQMPPQAKAACLVNGAPVDPATLSAALDLQNATGSQKRMLAMIDLMMPPILEMIKQSNQEISQEALDAFKNAFRAEMMTGLPEVMNEIACVTARHYTLAELQQIKAFYGTAIGKKLLKETPEVMTESAAIGMAWGSEAGKAAAARVIERLRLKGVKILKSAVVVFPASNCDRDAATALEQLTGNKTHMVWHQDSALPDVDLVVLPGGFSYGDYLRCGAMASQSAIMRAVKAHADKGGAVIGICNGFQVLTESHMLPGALVRNADLKFVCRPVTLEVEETQSAFTRKYQKGQQVSFPVAHGEGNYVADEETLDRLENENRVVFRYADGDNPNGSARNIAGILNEKRNVLGLMPHPERVVDPLLGGTDGTALFQSLIESLS